MVVSNKKWLEFSGTHKYGLDFFDCWSTKYIYTYLFWFNDKKLGVNISSFF